jgi:outer membrane receptor for ferrienterochelin and colicins
MRTCTSLARRSSGLGATILMLLAQPGAARADHPMSARLESMSLEELMEIRVYAASRQEQRTTEAPASVTIVTAEQIRRYGWRTLFDVLRSVRGFHVSYDRSYASVGVRGILRQGDYNTRVLMLVDGHRVNDMIYGQNGLTHEFPVDVDLVDRMEIVRGPTSALFGSNAFFAVVNVITRRGGAVDGVEVSGAVAGADTYQGRATFGAAGATGRRVLLSASGYASQGRDLFYPEFTANDGGVATGMDGEGRASAYGSATLGDFALGVAYNHRVKEVPTASYGTIFNDPRYKTWDDRAWLDLSWHRSLGDGTEVSARAFYDWYRYTGDYPYAGVDDTVVPPRDYTYLNKDGAENQWYGAEVLLSRRLGQSNRLTAGGEYRDAFQLDQWNHDEDPFLQTLDDRRTERIWALFLQGEATLGGGVTLTAGLRYDRYSTFGGTFNPRLAAVWTPRSGTTLKLLYGSAFRAPNAYETFYDDGGITQFGNTDLVPEAIQTYELVLEQGLGEHARFTVTAFQSRILDLIGQVPFDPAAPDSPVIFRNVGEARAVGAEAEIEGKWRSGEARLGYSWQDASDRTTGAWLDNSPRHLLKGQLSTAFWGDRIVPALDLQYTSRRKTLAGSFAGAHWLAAFTLSARRVLPGLEVSASVHNLLGATYADPGTDINAQDTILQDGRSFRLKATASF